MTQPEHYKINNRDNTIHFYLKDSCVIDEQCVCHPKPLYRNNIYIHGLKETTDRENKVLINRYKFWRYLCYEIADYGER